MTVAHIIMIFLMIVLVEMKKLYTGLKCWNRVSPYLWPNYQINMHMTRLKMWVFLRYTSCHQEFIIHFSFATCKEIKSLCLKQGKSLFSSGRGMIAIREKNQWLNSNSHGKLAVRAEEAIFICCISRRQASITEQIKTQYKIKA